MQLLKRNRKKVIEVHAANLLFDIEIPSRTESIVLKWESSSKEIANV